MIDDNAAPAPKPLHVGQRVRHGAHGDGVILYVLDADEPGRGDEVYAVRWDRTPHKIPRPYIPPDELTPL